MSWDTLRKLKKDDIIDFLIKNYYKEPEELEVLCFLRQLAYNEYNRRL